MFTLWQSCMKHLGETFHWHYSLTKYSLLQWSRPVHTSLFPGDFSSFSCIHSPVKQNPQARFSTNYARFVCPLHAHYPVILLWSYVCYTTNTLDTIEAFIAETYVQLAATKSMCYSTGCEHATPHPAHN